VSGIREFSAISTPKIAAAAVLGTPMAVVMMEVVLVVKRATIKDGKYVFVSTYI